MRFRGQASSVIKQFNDYRKNRGNIYSLIKNVCMLFDMATQEQLTIPDYKFLKFISSEIGIPQYFDLLCKKNDVVNTEVGLSDLLSNIQDGELFIEKDAFLHRYQKEVYDSFVEKQQNRFFLSAPTSFGKTYTVFEIIKKMAYNNAVLIFPTIALLGENYLKILDLKNKDKFWGEYRVHTLSDELAVEGKNLWIYTPERFMSFTDKNQELDFDFIFIDEIYKIDNQYIIDIETVGENERDISFRVALFDACLKSKDILLAGPYITFPKNHSNKSLQAFLDENQFDVLNYNNIEIVNKSFLDVQEKKQYNIDNIQFYIKHKDKKKKLNTVLESIQKTNDNTDGTIVYCGRKLETEHLANYLIQHGQRLENMKDELVEFIDHLSGTFGDDWIVVKALNAGIGIHHGLVPKYVQREVISLFNSGAINILLSTTTITEGINTTAKNVIVMSDMKGTKALKHFDAQNIAGRAGRFNSHFSGRVVAIDNNFMTTLFEDGECLTHKSYDKTSNKTDIDIDISKEHYLSDSDKERKARISQLVTESGIPDNIINSFKTVSKINKILIFKKIQSLDNYEKKFIAKLCKKLTYGDFDWDGFDVICNIMSEFVQEESLKALMEQPIKNQHVLLTAKVYFYLNQGFMGVLQNEKTFYNKKTDSAIREAAKTVFNVFRYQLSKYLGVFDLLYRYYISIEQGMSIDDVLGLGILIQRLEYGSLVEKAKKANDYGVPFSIIRYYETESMQIVRGFDAYEQKIFNKIKDVLN